MDTTEDADLVAPLLKRVRQCDECKYDFIKDRPLRQYQKHKQKGRKRSSIVPVHDSSHDIITDVSSTSTPNEMNLLDVTKADFDNQYNDNEVVQTYTEGSMLSTLTTYIHELKQYGAIAPCDNLMRIFAVQDMSLATSQLKPCSFVFVSRKFMVFCGVAYWVFTCSCNSSRRDLVDSMPSHVELSFTAFEEMYPTCLHGQAVKEIVKHFDSIHDICAASDFTDHTYSQRSQPVMPLSEESSEMDIVKNDDSLLNIIPLCNGKAVCICVNNEYGVVCVSKGKVVCCTCRYGGCSHVTSLFEILPNHPSLSTFSCELQLQVSTQAKQQTKCPKPCVSTSKIPFKPSQQQQVVMRQDYSSRFNIIDNVAKLVPEPSPCPLCGGSDTGSTQHQRDVKLVSATHVIQGKVYKRCCESPNCNGTILFDSDEICALDMTSILVTYELLQTFMLHFLLGRITMYTQYTVIKELQKHLGNNSLPDTMTYNQFRLSWYHYMRLLDIDYEQGFVCSECGTQPQVVIMDGTSLAFRRELDSWQMFLSQHDDKGKERISGR